MASVVATLLLLIYKVINIPEIEGKVPSSFEALSLENYEVHKDWCAVGLLCSRCGNLAPLLGSMG